MVRDLTAPSRDHAVLGVGASAGVAEIRRAFRARALELHPDRNGAPNAAAAFSEARQAYEALMVRSRNVGVYLDGIVSHTGGAPPARPGGARPGRRARDGEADRGAWQRIRFDLHRTLVERWAAAVRGRLWKRAADVWAVETHWTGVRDLRYGTCVRWDEIKQVREGPGVLDLVLTERGTRRLTQTAPNGAVEGGAYRLPVRDPARLAAVIRPLAHD
ncbi:MAG TPA: J domain-containing protein [Rubricoccaceae bacterium]|jgi:hypothetical protein